MSMNYEEMLAAAEDKQSFCADRNKPARKTEYHKNACVLTMCRALPAPHGCASFGQYMLTGVCKAGEIPAMADPEPGDKLTGNRSAVQAAEKDSVAGTVVREITPRP